MEAIRTIEQRLRLKNSEIALVWGNDSYSYNDFMGLVDSWVERLPEYKITPGLCCWFCRRVFASSVCLDFCFNEDKGRAGAFHKRNRT